MNPNLNNIAVKALDPEHGAKIVAAFEKSGIVTGLKGDAEKEYYFSHDGYLDCIPSIPEGYKEISLSELEAIVDGNNTFPRMMMVSDGLFGQDWQKRNVLGIFKERYVVDEEGHTHWHIYKYAEEIPNTQNPLLLTRAEIAEKFNVTDFEIVD